MCPSVKVLCVRQGKTTMSQDIEVEILVNGKPVKKFSHENKTYIQANKGSAYSIKIKNNSWKRRMFTVSVDGINVVNGQPAGKSDIGYVLSGYCSYEVKGFRTSNDDVHPFKFNDKQKSYAAKSDETQGDVSNCGVIGVMVFDEKEKPQPIIKHIHHHHKVIEKEYIPVPTYPRYPDITWTSPLYRDHTGTPDFTYTCSSNNVGARGMSASFNGGELTRSCNFMSVESPAPVEDNDYGTTVSDWAAGTEFSKESVTDKVTNTTFETGAIVATIEIFYDYKEGLLKKGVPIYKEVKVAAPQAFPSAFCKPPRD